ncbi:MAG: DUF3179 domain-containing protein [Gammaproteobacteria bacterium]|nr:DUF3179 domain-containing protein [Gammaproteobacteria bacterium]
MELRIAVTALNATLYIIGLTTALAIFLPFSPMTIDLVNVSRRTQISIYRHRRMLWAFTWICFGAILLSGLIGVLGSHGAMGTDNAIYHFLATPNPTWLWTTLITIGVLTLLFWSGYVPYVMTPPSRQRVLTAAEADRILHPDDVVLGLVYGNKVRAYPRDAIARPHYFTDTIDNMPMTISYCILCNSGIAFKSELNGRPLKLMSVTAYNNNIIYYDKAMDNFIQQLDGKVIDGPDVGKSLDTYPVAQTTWEEWKKLHPETSLYYAPHITLRDKMVAKMLQMLIPVAKLSKRSKPWHRIQGQLDSRLPAMSFVVGVEINADSCGYPLELVRQHPVLNDVVGGKPIVLLYDNEHDVVGVFSRRLDSATLTFEPWNDPGAPTLVRDQETGGLWAVTGKGVEGSAHGKTLEPIPHFNKLFWFSWALFKPGTRIGTPTPTG